MITTEQLDTIRDAITVLDDFSMDHGGMDYFDGWKTGRGEATAQLAKIALESFRSFCEVTLDLGPG